MNSNTLITIFAHAGTEPIVRRHFPLWERHGCDLLILSPTDAPIRQEFRCARLSYLNSGQSQYAGPVAIARFKTAFNWLSVSSYDRFLVLEYDAFCLSPEIPNVGCNDPLPRAAQASGSAFWGNRMATNNPWWSRAFKTPWLFYAPWLFSKTTLQRLCEAFEQMPNSIEGGCFDRYLDKALSIAGLTSADWDQRGFAMEKITEPAGCDAMTRAIKYGATMIHGVKTESVLKSALAAFGQ